MPGIEVYPNEISAHWEIEQPHSSSSAERELAAIHALEAVGRQMVDGWNSAPVPQKFSYHNVKLLRIEGGDSETHVDPITNVSHHKAWGTGIGQLEYTLG